MAHSGATAHLTADSVSLALAEWETNDWGGWPGHEFPILLFVRLRLEHIIPLRHWGVNLNEGAPSSVFEGGGLVLYAEGTQALLRSRRTSFSYLRLLPRLPLLGTAQARTRFVEELARVRREYHFLLVGYVVRPNHVHLLMSEPKKGTPSRWCCKC